MTSTTTPKEEEEAEDQKELQGAKHYLDNVARFTVLHAKDLIALLSPQIESAQTVLDIGCGPGTFGLAYLEVFPKGIPGQTLILSDLFAQMVQQAEQVMNERVPPDFATTLKYQVADGLTLEGIPDDSVDVVVSVFGIFIIPDYVQTLTCIRRVLRKDNPNAILGNVCWTMTEQRKALQEEGYGPSFHELIEESLQELTSLKGDCKEEPPWKRWFDPARAEQMMVEDAGYDKDSFQAHRVMHSVVWPSATAIWNMIATNPMVHQAAPKKMETAKQNLFRALGQDKDDHPQLPIVVSTASNLFLARPSAHTKSIDWWLEEQPAGPRTTYWTGLRSFRSYIEFYMSFLASKLCIWNPSLSTAGIPVAKNLL